MNHKRRCGILLHPTSLPGGRVGTLGKNAFRFLDLLSSSGATLWQILPLNPPACSNSPYSCFSAFAGNPLLIDIEDIAAEGDIPAGCPEFGESVCRADFMAAETVSRSALETAAAGFFAEGRSARMEEFWHFCDSTPWLHGYALFMSLKEKYKGKSWHLWPKDVSLITAETYEKASVDLGPRIGYHKYVQWQFRRQWLKVRAYAESKGIAIIGDIPIFVAYDSADVWLNRRLFLLDAKGRPSFVAGVPPDYFSSKGQLWGNPLYDWNAMEAEGYGWWIERFKRALETVHIIRIDHFRGFQAAWNVPASHKNAVKGKWVDGPGVNLFNAVRNALGSLPLIAEDLGVITPDVEMLRDYQELPGMKILQFAFGSGADNPYLPHNHRRRCVVYTGTHDNDTTAGWVDSLDQETRTDVAAYLGTDGSNLSGDLMRAALMSVADTVILPFQDLLGLDSSARMNVPGVAEGNWEWRFDWSQIDNAMLEEFRGLLTRYGRMP